MKCKKDLKGYTLLEVMFVIAICGVLLSVGAPTLGGLMSASHVQAGTQALTSSLSLARSEAIKRNARVVVCKSSNGLNCEPGSSWAQGWIVFHDVNNNAMVDPGEQLLLRESGLPDALRLSGNAQLNHYVSYTHHGRTHTISGAFQAGTFAVCAGTSKGLRASQVIINSNGRVRVARAGGAECA